jgi:cardiolipin synthase A/B
VRSRVPRSDRCYGRETAAGASGPTKTEPRPPVASRLQPATTRWPAYGQRRTLRRSGVGLLVLVVVWLLVSAAHGVRDFLRGGTVRLASVEVARPPSVADPQFLRTMEVLIQTTLREGNRAEAFTSGKATFTRLWADLRSARSSITVQMYYCEGAAVTDTLVAILAERARAGVAVFFLGDGYGCKDLPRRNRAALRSAGVHSATFRPVRWYSVHQAQHRSHGRIVVIDGRIGYTGGFGLSDKWYSGRPDEWRESDVRITGPAVTQLQGAFTTAWLEATGELLTGTAFFPDPDSDGDLLAGLYFATPTLGSSTAERFLALSIAGASATLYITNAYFVPDADFRALLARAAARGVDVRILTAGQTADLRSVRYASRAHYAELLVAGVRIYEYEASMMHGKALVADGLWSAVGSMNFDNRSLRLNDETVFVAYDRRFGAIMDSVFLADLRYASEIELQAFRRRPWRERVLERAANLIGWLL